MDELLLTEKSAHSFDEYTLAVNHAEKLLDRRQFTTSFYLSVNTGIVAVIGLLLQGGPLTNIWKAGAIILLLGAGFIACWIWRSLLHQYETLLRWWYARIRELEVTVPHSAKLITREYEDLYVAADRAKPAQRIGLTQREMALNLILTVLYSIFTVSIVVWMSLIYW